MTQTSSWDIPSPSNIIIRMPNWLGDAVMAAPLLQDIKEHYPQAKLTAMCQGPIAALFQHDPYIDEIYSFAKPSGWIHRPEHLDIINDIRHGKYDLGILTTNSFSSAWWFWRGKVKNILGYKGHWRKWLLSKALDYPENVETQHLVLTYKMLLAPLGIPVSNTSPTLYVSKEEALGAEAKLKAVGINPQQDIIVGINPGAAYGSAKCWLPDRFEAVARKLLENPHVRILFFGDSKGQKLVDDICTKLPERVINFAGKTTIRELIALIDACSIFLTNDSGPMHIAAALHKPLLALFGSTSDVKTGPYGGGKVLHKHVECSPCYKRECPIDFRCMTRISVDEVYQELNALIAKQSH